MLSSFTSMGLIVASDLWSELQEYGLLESCLQPMVPFEESALREEEAQSERRDNNTGQCVLESREEI